MSKEPMKPFGPKADQDKPHTPDTLRNDDAPWKAHDMPDEDRDSNQVDPEHDYDRPDGSERR
ncbi:hypothetical protein HF319_00850 [Xanthomonas sp. Kuri4-1]